MPGVDPIYGAGLLNVEKAMQAQAPASSFAAAQTVLARYSSLEVSAPFGGAATASMIATAAASMTVFDRYGRDFAMTAATGIRARTSGLLAGGMAGSGDPLPLRRWSVTEARLGFAGQDVVGPWQGATSDRPAMASFSPAAGETVTIGANTAVGSGASSLAGSPLRGAVGQLVGLWSSWSGGGWSASFSSGSSRDRRADLRGITFSTPLGIGLELTNLAEHGRVLGFGGGMAASGLRGGRTTLATVVARRMVAGVALTARATTGSTSVDDGDDGPIRFDGRIVSTAFAVEGAHPVFGGLATLGLSSPLRVERARASLLVPVAYDLMSGALAEERRTFDLSPTARELDLELGWSTALAPSSTLRVGVARAFDAGHVRSASDVAAFLNFVIR